MLLIAAIVSTLAVLAGASVIARNDSPASTPNGAASAATATSASAGAGATPAGVGAAGEATNPTADAAASGAGIPTQQAGGQPGDIVLPQTKQPAFELPTNGLAHVREVYAEAHTVGLFTVRWRPGAFPPEKANEIATQAERSLATVNQLLGTSYAEPMEIFLADQLFNEECWGCQGFAAADLWQVFILQDGSVGPEELPSLLTHEIGHVIAAHAVALPESLFFAEGLAVWLSDGDIQAQGFVSAKQTAAWALQAGVFPTIDQLLAGDYAGRVRARAEYDAAASFTFYVVETLGLNTYLDLYRASRNDKMTASEVVLGKDWQTVEGEWHAWLQQWADANVAGVDGVAWWTAAEQVMSGFRYLYSYPDQVSAEQYAALSASRWELNRLRLDNAAALATRSGVTSGTAN